MGTLTRDVQRLGPELYNGIDKDSLAYKMLASMGWQEGQGLGANKQGIKEHLKVKKKFDTMGMGAAEAGKRAREWTAGMWTYDRVLSTLKEVKAQHIHKDGDSSGSSSSDEEEEQAKKRYSKTSTKPKVTKKKKSAAPSSSDSSSSSSSSSDGGSSSGNESDSDTSSPAPVKPNRVRVASHAGRYQKRERAKLVKGYSANDLAAILGAAPTNTASNGQVVDKKSIAAGKAPTPDNSSSESGSESDQERDASSSQDSEDSDTGAVVANVGKQSAGKDDAAAVPSPHDDGSIPTAGVPAWWAGIFVKSGRVGGADNGRQKRAKGSKSQGNGSSIHINGFKEQDQENLYNSVHAGAVQGKQGLGRADMPNKVAGARWAGKKTKLGSDSEESENEGSDNENGSCDSEGDADTEPAPAAGGKIVIVAAKSSQQQATQQPQAGIPVQQLSEKASVKEKKQVQLSTPVCQQSSDKTGKNKKQKRSKEASAEEPANDSAAKKQKKTASDVREGDDKVEQAGKIKWAKLIQTLLEAAPKKRLKLEKLKKKLLKSDQIKAGLAAGNSCLIKLEKRLLKKVRRCSKFTIQDGVVSLQP